MQRKKNIACYIRYLPVYGCVSTGLIYSGIGVVAILSFLKIKDGGADESSLLAFLHEYFAGRIAFWVIFLGTVCYVVWRIFESIKDPYAYGQDIKAIAKRAGIAVSTIPDVLIALTGMQILAGTGSMAALLSCARWQHPCSNNNGARSCLLQQESSPASLP
jgi:hypothetical protein